MKLGKRIRRLWQLRRWVAVAAVMSLLVAVYSVAKISLMPPKLTPRALEMATATTHVIVDTPVSSVLDLRQSTDSFQALTQRAILLGNVIANGTVREAIALRAHVPGDALEVAPPLTPAQPVPLAGSHNNSVSAIAKTTDQYRLSITADPIVPMLDIYAQAPNPASAATLANAAVDCLRQYLTSLAVSEQIPPRDQIRLLQLGRAHGNVINQGIYWQSAVLVFVLVFGLACATVIFLSRIRHGWEMAKIADQQAPV